MKTLYLFNPENDMALASASPYYMAPASIKKMAADLSALSAWYAPWGDYVLLADERQKKWMQEVCRFPLPVKYVHEFSKEFDNIIPWGWNPSLLHRLRELGIADTALISNEQLCYIRNISNRNMAVKLLPNVRREQTLGESFYTDSFENIEYYLSQYNEIMLKSPWSGSGKGVQKIVGAMNDSVAGWARRIISSQGGIVIEPFYFKIIDFALEFYADAQGLSFVGYSVFDTDSRGIYKGNVLASDKMLEKYLTAYISLETLLDVRRRCVEELQELIRGVYKGCLGVDMMICKDNDTYKIHPCVEINFRMNMGLVSRLLYDKYVCQGVEGSYVMEYFQNQGEALRFHENMKCHYPLQMENGRIKTGYLSLTPVFENTSYQIFIKVK